MNCRWVQHVSITAVTILLCCSSIVADEIEFEQVRAEFKVNTMALTEDGKHLVLAHKADNKITVWEVATGACLHTVEIDEPQFLLCRRQYVFVLNSDRGFITPLSKSRDYKASRPIDVGIVNPYYMSAPGGRFYKGQILVTGGKYADRKVARVDLLRRSSASVFDTVYMSLASVDYQGKSVLIQSEFSHSSPSSRLYDYDDFIDTEKRKTISRGLRTEGLYDWIHSVRPLEFWLSSNGVLAPKELRQLIGGDIVIGDEDTDLFYVIKDEQLVAHRYDKLFTETGRRTVRGARNHQKFRGMGSRKGYQISRPLAISDNGRLRIFLHDTRDGKVYRANTEAFPLRPNGTVQSPGNTQPNNKHRPTVDELDAMAVAKPTPTRVEAIVKAYANAVVYIKVGGAFRCGMVVGARGYVLTRAEGMILSGDGPPVNYRLKVGQRAVSMSGRGQIVHFDKESDLVLLKVDVTGALPSVQLASEPKLVAGAAIHIIDPSAAEPISAKLGELNLKSGGQPFLTSSPSLPKGVMGSPVFDSAGQVVAMVSHRDGSADRSLLIGIDRLRAFLKSAIKTGK